MPASVSVILSFFLFLCLLQVQFSCWLAGALCVIGHALSSKGELMCTLFHKGVPSRILSGFIFQSNCLISRMSLSLHISAAKGLFYCHNVEYIFNLHKNKIVFSSRNKNFLLLEFSLTWFLNISINVLWLVFFFFTLRRLYDDYSVDSCKYAFQATTLDS